MVTRRLDRRTYLQPPPDSHPHLPVERSSHGRGVGRWVPEMKHRLLADFIEATWGARKKWPHRVYIDLFCASGRVQVTGEAGTRPGGAVVAWRQSARKPEAAFTQMLLGDLDPTRLEACVTRLKALGAPAIGEAGPALETVHRAVASVPSKGALVLAYLDPYSLGLLDFSIIRALAALPHIDFAVHFSTYDLHRNVDMELSPDRDRFERVAPGWREQADVAVRSKRGLREAFFEHWRAQVRALGFQFSEVMPLVRGDQNAPMYRLVFFSRNALPNDIWADVAQGPTRDLFA